MGGAAVPVEPQVFDVLVYLIENRDRVVSKDDLIASVWGGRIVSESTLTSRINAVRKAIGDSGDKQEFDPHVCQRKAFAGSHPWKSGNKETATRRQNNILLYGAAKAVHRRPSLQQHEWRCRTTILSSTA